MPESDERDLTELMIRMLRAVSTSSLFGYGYPEVFEDFTVAEEICRRLTDRPEIMPAQVGIWSYLLVRGSVDDASQRARAPDRRARRACRRSGSRPRSSRAWVTARSTRAGSTRRYRWLVEAWEGYRARSLDAATSARSGRSPTTPCRSPRSPWPASPRSKAERARAWPGSGGPSPRRSSSTSRRGPFSAAFVIDLSGLDPDDDGRPRGRRASSGGARWRSGSATASTTSSCSAGSTCWCPTRTDRPHVEELEMYGQGMEPWATGRSARRTSASSPRTTTTSATPTQALKHPRRRHGAGPGPRGSWSINPTSCASAPRSPPAARPRPDGRGRGGPRRRRRDRLSSQGSVVFALRAANDLARLPDDDRPADWTDRIRSVIDRFPPNSSSPELGAALELLGV